MATEAEPLTAIEVLRALIDAGYVSAYHSPIPGAEGMRVWREGFTVTREAGGVFVDAKGAGHRVAEVLEGYAEALREAGIGAVCRDGRVDCLGHLPS